MALGGLAGGLMGGAAVSIVINAVDNFSKVLNNAQMQVKGFGSFIKRHSAALVMGGAAVTGAMTAMGVSAVKSFATFQEQMTNSMNMFDNVTKQDRAAADKLAKELSEKLALAPQEVAKAFWYFGSAGMNVKETMGSLSPVLKFAKVNTLDIGEASNFAMTMMKVWNVKAKDLPKTLDIATTAMKNHKVSMDEMAQSFSYVAPVAAKFGIKVSELSEVIGVLGDAGITGSMAGTVLRRSLLNLTSPTSEMKSLMEKLGIKVYDNNGKFRGLLPVLKSVEKATKGMSDAQKAATLKTLFGTRAVAGMSAILDTGVDKLQAMIDKTNESTGTMDEMNKAIEDTAANKMKKFQVAITNLKISLGEALLPVLTNLLNILKPIVTWFSNLPNSMKLVIVVGGALIGILMMLSPILVSLIPVLFSVAGGIGAISIAGMPLWAIILAIIAAIGIAILIWKKWDKIIKVLKIGIIAVKTAFVDFWNWLKKIGDWLKNTFLKVLDKVKSIINKIKNAIKGIGHKIGGLGKTASHMYLGGTTIKVSKTAEGGIFTKPSLRLIGEAGPEAVIPLSKAGGLGATININGNIYGVDADDIAEAMHKRLRDMIAY